MKKTVLVSGSEGFVGKHLVPKLREAGYIVDRVTLLPGSRAGVHNAHVEYDENGSMLCENGLVPFLNLLYGLTKPVYDVVIHLAANVKSIDFRMVGGMNALSDITLDMAMFNYIAANPPKQAFIYPSSCAIDNPEDPYAFVKIVGERCCKELHRQGVPVVILRPFSGYGADQSQEYPFSAILKRVMDGDNPVEVWGDGKQIRDFIHISDLVDAFIYAINSFPRGVPIDIGTGVGNTLNCLAGTMIDKAFPDSPPDEWPEIKPRLDKPSSSRKRVAKISEAGNYGWHSKISLEEGIGMEVEAWRKLHP